MNKETLIAKYMEKLKIDREAAEELYNADLAIDRSTKPLEGELVVEKVAKAKKVGITKEELDSMKEMLPVMFPENKPFKNKELRILCEELHLTARQTPSRLKALVEEGFLGDLGGNPKQYKVL